eukprot:11219060-Lingulodinium_polyedra.AAC.1
MACRGLPARVAWGRSRGGGIAAPIEIPHPTDRAETYLDICRQVLWESRPTILWPSKPDGRVPASDRRAS